MIAVAPVRSFVAALALAASGLLSAQIAMPPNPGDARPDQFSEIDAVPFATAGGHTLVTDVYMPKGQGPGPFPGVVFVHGGGWGGGSRLDNRRPATYLAAHGYVVLSFEYRLAPLGHYPDQMADCRAAIQWFLRHGAEYKLDPARIALAGISAGGHLVAMLGLDHPDPAVKAVVSISGVDNLDDPAANNLLGSIARLIGHPCSEDPEPCRQASPVNNVHAGAPPFLVMHGDNDIVALSSDTRLFVERLTAVHDHVETFWAKGGGHPFWHEEPWILPAEETMVRFLDGYLKGSRLAYP